MLAFEARFVARAVVDDRPAPPRELFEVEVETGFEFPFFLRKNVLKLIGRNREPHAVRGMLPPAHEQAEPVGFRRRIHRVLPHLVKRVADRFSRPLDHGAGFGQLRDCGHYRCQRVERTFVVREFGKVDVGETERAAEVQRARRLDLYPA